MTARRILSHPLLWTAVVFVILPQVAGANPFTGQSGFVDIAAALRLPVRDESDHERIVRATLDWLTANDRWLLILDNVSDRRLIDRFAPDRAAGDVLVTSRERVFAEAGMPRALDVGDLNEDEAVAFLLARTGRRDPQRPERAAASALAAELGYLPLALEQAAAYIAETDAAFGDYLEAFRKRRLTLLERSSALVARDTVAVTWAANFEAVASLRVFSWGSRAVLVSNLRL